MPRYVPRNRKRLTFAYTRPRRRPARRKEAQHEADVNTEIVAFDHGPAEFPVATVRPRETRGRAVAALADLQRWMMARWNWFKPRTVPCAVAALGMLAVIASADYLAHHMDQNPPQTQKILHVDIAAR
jgi:hypothetical protein